MSNGNLPASELAPVPGGQLAKNAALWFNRMRRAAQKDGLVLEIRDGYRPLGERGDLAKGKWSQWAAWERYQRNGSPVAAKPGTSNHGWGTAIDIKTPSMAQWIKANGKKYGWAKTEAPTEWWHYNFVGVHRPVRKNVIQLNGIDVSEHNGNIDWPMVASGGVRFAWVKATEGQDFVDHKFSKARLDSARAAGITVGVYHFARPQRDRSGATEARHFVTTAKSRGAFQKGDLKGVLDVEWSKELGVHELRAWIESFVAEHKRLTGHNPVIYTGNWWRDTLGNPETSFGCFLWLAAYVQDSSRYIPKAWQRWTCWQWTSSGRVNGINGPVDMNVARRTHLHTRLKIR